ncbi:MAG: prephenate dehydrogenase/arogenate dehydrogenase family protein [Opitutaceae bacterium]|nr:prephenate dehydrogenase/arogenate dehydrogenase family protein [Opitutaceae bacterium]
MIEKLAILAPGLIGASVARAARARGAARHITLWSRKPSARAALRRQPWCDAVAATPQAAVDGADLVVLAAPVDVIIGLLPQIAPALKPGALVTDVGSTKRGILAAAARAVRGAVFFIGSHPMAGSEKTGWRNATETLFDNRAIFLTPRKNTPAARLRELGRFWKTLGGRVSVVTPEAHDRIVAAVSHLPQAVATALAATLAAQNPGWGRYAGNGLRDTTRVAAGDPAMWLPIFRHNRAGILGQLRRFRRQLDAVESALAAGDEAALLKLLRAGGGFRRSLDRTPRKTAAKKQLPRPPARLA